MLVTGREGLGVCSLPVKVMARVSLCVFCFCLDCLTLTEGHPHKGWALMPCDPGLCLAQVWMLKLQSAESWLPPTGGSSFLLLNRSPFSVP